MRSTVHILLLFISPVVHWSVADSVQWTRESVSDGVFTALFSDGTPGWVQIEFWEISSDVLHPVRNLKTNSSAQAGGALRVPAREQRAPEIRGHLLEMSARRVQSVAAQDRDSHRTADQNQNQDQDRAGFSRSVADVLYNISRFNRVIHEFCAEKRAAVKRPGPLDCRNVFRIAQFSFFAW